jgi:hypothetical protein
MTTLRVVALLLVANTVIFVAGVLGGGGKGGLKRPFWLPPLSIRAGIPLAGAGGLWFGQEQVHGFFAFSPVRVRSNLSRVGIVINDVTIALVVRFGRNYGRNERTT